MKITSSTTIALQCCFLVDQRPCASHNPSNSTNFISTFYRNASRRRRSRVAVATLATAISRFQPSPIQLDYLLNFTKTYIAESSTIHQQHHGQFRPSPLLNHFAIDRRKWRAAAFVAAASTIGSTDSQTNFYNNHLSSSSPFATYQSPQIKRICRTQNASSKFTIFVYVLDFYKKRESLCNFDIPSVFSGITWITQIQSISADKKTLIFFNIEKIKL